MKTKILILMGNMECGGVQVSLLNFLNELMKYNVDISLLFEGNEGDWWGRLPQGIKVEMMQYSQKGYGNMLVPTRKLSIVQNILYHIAVHIADMKRGGNRNSRYSFLLNHMQNIDEHYDIAIDYHGYGFFTTSVLTEKIHSNYKAVFVHDEKIDCLYGVKGDLKKVDAIYCVSHSCEKYIKETFPALAEKTQYFPNFINKKEVLFKAAMPITDISKEKLTLITVGRVMWQKGYDLAVETAALLKEKGIDFNWYCIGNGALMEEIKALIIARKVTDCFFMLGQKDNPFPYINAADIYVQTSRHEGFGLAVAEALILKKVVVSTNIECIAEQLKYGECGILVEYDAIQMCNAIIDVANNMEKQVRIKEKLSQQDEVADKYIKKLLSNIGEK